MGKVSIGLRGWRFDEADVFDANGAIKSLAEMPPEPRRRVSRLTAILGNACDVCMVLEDDERHCNVASAVYGEPMHEVLLCAEHEPDFFYWFRELGGEEYAGSTALSDTFLEWIADGGRAPDDYGEIEHVDSEPDALPDAAVAGGIPSLEAELEEMDEGEREALDVDLGDLDT
ncbi:hypothetical protein [Halapricum desulfuricans]|uniref:Uncharacterized protein n=1 Tax=Halapricum desulfuricans TaxID=2841257 RepID=A0A897N9L3_9EURY|nr:hypothetical protein [Halapricum desulfuricans]QSG09387.1 Uncharacterized protein HSR122_2002 [Halapricum desulfuricans]QSG12287.1 Uncharacterized protein HSBGL_1876 [Halapricum desulfuricans]